MKRTRNLVDGTRAGVVNEPKDEEVSSRILVNDTKGHIVDPYLKTVSSKTLHCLNCLVTIVH